MEATKLSSYVPASMTESNLNWVLSSNVRSSKCLYDDLIRNLSSLDYQQVQPNARLVVK